MGMTTHTAVLARRAYKQTCFYSCTQTFSSISCVFAALLFRDLPWLDGVSPSTPLHGRDQPLSASPQTGEKKLLNAISGLSRQLTQFAADVIEQFTLVWKILTLRREDGCTILKLRKQYAVFTTRRQIVGATNRSKAACKTYYETVRRSFRYKHPDLASQAEAVKHSARSRARRKRLLEARQSVLAEDEVGLWKCATIDLMSDEEDGIVGGVSGWIVRPPSFHSQELTELCATLQSRLEAIPKYRATHHRHQQNGLNSDRMPLVTYSSEAENRDFMVL
ncbi:hypothetical protein DPX16_22310 [Anabarilius grahami]|uniref:Uncharacterized protein n=1 Tax=Anabarilius grahami TaxID=495550 RepID=A0A3N0YWP4_ANAGA|nr:hypothetical protein DPX16_22310 [Anabarilius grahami]